MSERAEVSLHSMTGFGGAQGQVGSWQLGFEIKAVNHKALEVRFHTRGSEWTHLEPLVHQAVRGRVRRGQLTVSLSVTPWVGEGSAASQPLDLDEAAFAATYKQLRTLTVRHGLRTDLSIADLMLFSRAFMGTSALAASDESALAGQALEVFGRALDAFMESRAREGAQLHALFEAQLKRLGQLVAEVAAARPALLDGYRERLRERIDEVLAGVQSGALDEARLVAEVALFADKTDIAEEIQRAGSHIERLLGLLSSEEPVGKQLDFYLQELIRETNTMASKSNFSALTDLIIQMKSIVEQLREQAANIE